MELYGLRLSRLLTAEEERLLESLLPPERLERLFTGLLDSESPTDAGRSNMGIGLSVCSTIIKAHGSDIRAENRPGGGARFSFALEMEENQDV